MPNRARNYMDRILGRNEGNESRDFSEGRRYGEDQNFYEERYQNEFSPSREDMYGRDHGLQSSRTRPRNGGQISDYERDYNVRRNPPTQDDYQAYGRDRMNRGGSEYNIRENESFRNRGFDSNPDRSSGRRFDRNDSFAGGDFRNTERFRTMNREESRGFFGKGPKGWKRSDERIKEEVSEALYRDYHVDASEIEIEVKEGVVTLSGTVENREAKRSAEECIENLSGVQDVHNRIRIVDNSNVSNLRNTNERDEKRSLS